MYSLFRVFSFSSPLHLLVFNGRKVIAYKYIQAGEKCHFFIHTLTVFHPAEKASGCIADKLKGVEDCCSRVENEKL